jgi:hypothetical protein
MLVQCAWYGLPLIHPDDKEREVTPLSELLDPSSRRLRVQDFVDLVKHFKFSIVEVQDVDDKYGNGFTVVVQKPPR